MDQLIDFTCIIQKRRLTWQKNNGKKNYLSEPDFLCQVGKDPKYIFGRDWSH